MIRIVTDTGSNIPVDLAEEFKIEVASGHIVFGDEVILEYPDLKTADFYRRLAASKQLPMTRDSGVKDFKTIYDRILAQTPGATILSIHVSEPLATTINSARQAAALLPSARVVLFDTQSVSFAEGLMVWEAARMARDGAQIEVILERLRDMRNRVEVYIVVDTLEYLGRGGRVGPAARFAGGLLDVKPILTVRDGLVQSHAQYRTRARALIELEQLALSKCAGKKGLRIGVMHAMCLDDAKQIAEDIKRKLTPEYLMIAEIGPAVGTHTGPGAVGITWYAPA